MVARLEQGLVAQDELQPRDQLPLAETVRTNSRKAARRKGAILTCRLHSQFRKTKEVRKNT